MLLATVGGFVVLRGHWLEMAATPNAHRRPLRIIILGVIIEIFVAALFAGKEGCEAMRLHSEIVASEIKNAPENQIIATATAIVTATSPKDLVSGGLWSDTPALANLQFGFVTNGQFIPQLILFSTHLAIAGNQLSANFASDETKWRLPKMSVKDFKSEVNALIVNAIDPHDNTAKMTLTNGTVSLQLNSLKWDFDLPPQTNSDFRIFATNLGNVHLGAKSAMNPGKLSPAVALVLIFAIVGVLVISVIIYAIRA